MVRSVVDATLIQAHGDRTMKTFTVTYNVTLAIDVQADSADEAERLADRELPLHCDVNRAVSCHRIAASAPRTREDNRTVAR